MGCSRVGARLAGFMDADGHKVTVLDTDAYSFSGGLCKSNQGLMEFVEMFKAPIKVLQVMDFEKLKVAFAKAPRKNTLTYNLQKAIDKKCFCLYSLRLSFWKFIDISR